MNCMNVLKSLGSVTIITVGLGGCANMTPQEQNRATGQIVGGVTGAALGSLVGGGTGRSIAIGAGAVIGTVVGGEIGGRQ